MIKRNGKTNTRTSVSEKYPIPRNWIINAILIFVFTAIYYALTQKTVTEPAFDIPYSEFKQLLNDGALASVTLKGNQAEGTLLQATSIGPQQEMSKFSKHAFPILVMKVCYPLSMRILVIPITHTGFIRSPKPVISDRLTLRSNIMHH